MSFDGSSGLKGEPKILLGFAKGDSRALDVILVILDVLLVFFRSRGFSRGILGGWGSLRRGIGGSMNELTSLRSFLMSFSVSGFGVS